MYVAKYKCAALHCVRIGAVKVFLLIVIVILVIVIVLTLRIPNTGQYQSNNGTIEAPMKNKCIGTSYSAGFFNCNCVLVRTFF